MTNRANEGKQQDADYAETRGFRGLYDSVRIHEALELWFRTEI